MLNILCILLSTYIFQQIQFNSLNSDILYIYTNDGNLVVEIHMNLLKLKTEYFV